MAELNRLMRSKLQSFALHKEAALKEAKLWPFRTTLASEETDDDIVTLGSFIPGLRA